MIEIIRCGYNSHHPHPMNRDHPEGLPHYLLLIVKSPAWFVFNKKRIDTKPNMVILFTPGTTISYGYDLPNYTDDFIHLRLSQEDLEIFSLIEFPCNVPVYLSEINTISRFAMSLTVTFFSNNLHSKYIQDALMRTILYSIDDEYRKEAEAVRHHRHYSVFSKLRTQIYNMPLRDWDVNHTAKSFMISVSYFQHLYKLFFQRSFRTDVILSRLEYSKLWLVASNYTIKGIAEKCGYQNELHYMRQFKKYTKQTPTEYRKNNAGILNIPLSEQLPGEIE